MTLKLSLNKWIEIIGTLGIISSLIFVGLQLRLEGRIAISEQYASRAESTKSDIRAMMESSEYIAKEAKLWESGVRPDWWNEDLMQLSDELELSGSDIATIYLERVLWLRHYDNLHFQYEQGFLGEGFWVGARASLKDRLREPFHRAVFQFQGNRLTSIINELVAEIDNEKQGHE